MSFSVSSDRFTALKRANTGWLAMYIYSFIIALCKFKSLLLEIIS